MAVSRENLQPEDIPARLRLLVGDEWGAQKQFAERLGVAPQTVNQYLSGARPVPLQFLLKVAETESVRLGWILEGEEPRHITQGIRTLISGPANTRGIPVLGRVPAGPPGGHVWTEFEAPNAVDLLNSIQDPYAIALEVRGESMWPALFPEDIVVMSPQAACQMGDIVVAEVQGTPDDYLVKRLGSDRDGHVVLISDNFLAYPPLTLDPEEVEIRGRVVRVIRTPSRRDARKQRSQALAEFYRDPKIPAIIEQLQGLSERARDFVIQNIELVAKAKI